MGNQGSYPSSLLTKNWQRIEANVLRNVITEELISENQITFSTEDEQDYYTSLLRRRANNNNPYIVKLIYFQHASKPSNCSFNKGSFQMRVYTQYLPIKFVSFLQNHQSESRVVKGCFCTHVMSGIQFLFERYGSFRVNEQNIFFPKEKKMQYRKENEQLSPKVWINVDLFKCEKSREGTQTEMIRDTINLLSKLGRCHHSLEPIQPSDMKQLHDRVITIHHQKLLQQRHVSKTVYVSNPSLHQTAIHSVQSHPNHIFPSEKRCSRSQSAVIPGEVEKNISNHKYLQEIQKTIEKKKNEAQNHENSFNNKLTPSDTNTDEVNKNSVLKMNQKCHKINFSYSNSSKSQRNKEIINNLNSSVGQSSKKISQFSYITNPQLIPSVESKAKDLKRHFMTNPLSIISNISGSLKPLKKIFNENQMQTKLEIIDHKIVEEEHSEMLNSPKQLKEDYFSSQNKNNQNSTQVPIQNYTIRIAESIEESIGKNVASKQEDVKNSEKLIKIDQSKSNKSQSSNNYQKYLQKFKEVTNQAKHKNDNKNKRKKQEEALMKEIKKQEEIRMKNSEDDEKQQKKEIMKELIETTSIYNESVRSRKNSFKEENLITSALNNRQIRKRIEKKELEKDLEREKEIIQKEMEILFKNNHFQDDYQSIQSIKEKVKHKKATFAELKAEASKILDDIYF